MPLTKVDRHKTLVSTRGAPAFPHAPRHVRMVPQVGSPCGYQHQRVRPFAPLGPQLGGGGCFWIRRSPSQAMIAPMREPDFSILDQPHHALDADQWGEHGYVLWAGRVYAYSIDRKEQQDEISREWSP